MTILIIIGDKVYRAKEEWPQIIHLEDGDTYLETSIEDVIGQMNCLEVVPDFRPAILAACFDEINTNVYDDFGRDAFSLDRLTGKEKP
ncbi:MAG: hypothetical protein WC356_06795 [Candidatus Micrarchaeia archaeon]|jgi:hypothetical protein